MPAQRALAASSSIPQDVPGAQVAWRAFRAPARLFVLVALTAFASACHGGDSSASIDLIITNGRIIDPASGAGVRTADIAIDQGLIVAVGTGLEHKYQAAQRVDATGRYVIPGLADMHTHFGTGVRQPDEDDTAPVLARLLYYGVTTTLNLGSFQGWPERIDSLRDEMNRGALDGPRLLATGALITIPGSHPTTTIYSPPLQARIAEVLVASPAQGPIDLSAETQRATTVVRTAREMREEVKRLGDWGANAIKIIVESGPDPFGNDHPQMSPQLISAAVAAASPFGIPVLCHVTSADELEACLDNGAAGLAHAVGAYAAPREIAGRMAAADMALIPTASLLDGWARYTANSSLLDDSLLAETLTSGERAWLGSQEMIATFSPGPDGTTRLANLRALLLAARDSGVLIVAGTDVGNPYRFPGYSLHEELALYVSAGLTPAEALATATVNAARLVGDEKKWGSIATGMAADLVILESNPLDDIANTRTIRSVIRDGSMVDRAALRIH